MKKLKSYLIPVLLGGMVCSSCGKTEVEDDDSSIIPENVVSFEAQLSGLSRATDTKFDSGDQISVFAVVADESGGKGVISDRGNYADNVKYTYDGSKFTSNNGIEIDEDGTEYFYHAVYPYTSSAASRFNFEVASDQQGDNYTLSDLCTAHSTATSSTLVELNFSHRLSKVIVTLEGNNWPSGDKSLTINQTKVNASVDLNALTFVAGSTNADVICADNGTNSFKAILPPQLLSSDSKFATLMIGETSYSVTLSGDIQLKSGVQTEISLTFDDDKAIVEFVGDINPWEEVDNRLEDVVPSDIRVKLEKYITIYNGVNPPNIEGTYFVDPFVTVYCEDEGNGGYEPGDVVNSMYMRFSNQNMTINTIDFEEKSITGSSSSVGKGAFISGNGDNFSAFFNTEGTTDGIYTKTALVISGTKTTSGIKNLQYAFVMVEKGSDPNGLVMQEGIFRVFKDEDGLSENSSWTSRAGLQLPKVSETTMYSVFSIKR